MIFVVCTVLFCLFCVTMGVGMLHWVWKRNGPIPVIIMAVVFGLFALSAC